MERQAWLTARVKATERAFVKAAADREGKSLSDYIRHAVFARIAAQYGDEQPTRRDSGAEG